MNLKFISLCLCVLCLGNSLGTSFTFNDSIGSVNYNATLNVVESFYVDDFSKMPH